LEKPNFKQGDRVQVRSGGPAMTVENVEGEAVRCVWMENVGTLKVPRYAKKQETFSAGTLIEFKRHAIGARF
jgi:uncharacterized protein YodC (DUF2158 family)